MMTASRAANPCRVLLAGALLVLTPEVLTMSSAAGALLQDAVTNASIEKLVKAGLSEEVIVSIVKSQPADFDLSADALIGLKQSGVSDRIIEAMTARGTTPAGQPADTGGLVTIPLKTPVQLAVDEELSSGSAKAGQSFALVLAEDLVVAGKVVACKGASAVGRVTAVQKKAFATRNGSIELAIDTVRAVDGQDIPLDGRVVEDGGAAGFGNLGKNVKVGKGASVAAVVAAERSVKVN